MLRLRMVELALFRALPRRRRGLMRRTCARVFRQQWKHSFILLSVVVTVQAAGPPPTPAAAFLPVASAGEVSSSRPGYDRDWRVRMQVLHQSGWRGIEGGSAGATPPIMCYHPRN